MIFLEPVHCNLGVVEIIQSGLGKNWVQFSLANDLFIGIQLTKEKSPHRKLLVTGPQHEN